MNIQRLGAGVVVVSDEAGTLRLFENPTLNKGYYQVYQDNLSYIQILVSSKSYLVSYSILDWLANKNPHSLDDLGESQRSVLTILEQFEDQPTIRLKIITLLFNSNKL